MTRKVQSYRKFIGYTQFQMARLLNISVQAYRNKEKDKTPFKDIEKVKIKEELQKNGFENITIDEIFFDNKVAKSFALDGR
ncbi:helix-turn-helix transcriptional regulator [Staphylococcus shinii]|uniref:helix-turn-helix transcriptional regulator n=1 Tax=Staphylococcus shinii TaxID=2912228 RepID=UPI003F86D152